MSEVSKENRKPYDLQYWPAISVSIEVPFEPGDPEPDTELTDNMLLEFDESPPGFPSEDIVVRPFAYFKHKGKIDPKKPLILKVRYTEKAWKESIAAGGGGNRPRIFFGVYNKNGWADEWEEITDNIEYFEPGIKGPFGYLKVTLYEVPDPAIGGC